MVPASVTLMRKFLNTVCNCICCVRRIMNANGIRGNLADSEACVRKLRSNQMFGTASTEINTSKSRIHRKMNELVEIDSRHT